MVIPSEVLLNRLGTAQSRPLQLDHMQVQFKVLDLCWLQKKKKKKGLHTHFTDITMFGNMLALKNVQVHPQWQFTFMETDQNNSVVH